VIRRYRDAWITWRMAGFAAGLADLVFLCVRHTAGRLGLLLLPLSLLLARPGCAGQ